MSSVPPLDIISFKVTLLTSCTWKYGCQNRDYVQEEPNVQYQVKVKTQVFLER